MTIGRRVVGMLCMCVVVAVGGACSSGDGDSASTKLSLQHVLGSKSRTDSCPTGTVADVSQPTCYDLAPAFLTQDDVQTAAAVYDATNKAWVVNAHVAASSRGRFVDQLTRVLLNEKVAIVVDGEVVNVFEIHPGITGSDFQVSSHAKWTKATATSVAAGIAKAKS